MWSRPRGIREIWGGDSGMSHVVALALYEAECVVMRSEFDWLLCCAGLAWSLGVGGNWGERFIFPIHCLPFIPAEAQGCRRYGSYWGHIIAQSPGLLHAQHALWKRRRMASAVLRDLRKLGKAPRGPGPGDRREGRSVAWRRFSRSCAYKHARLYCAAGFNLVVY
jgi:hypothetical protein